MTPAEWLLLTTIRIETVTPDGISTGTGFFFSFLHDKEKETGFPTVVTNKHVVQDAVSGRLRFSLQGENGAPRWGEFYDLVIDDFESLWIPHPDPAIDLCILPIASICRDLADRGVRLAVSPLTLYDIPPRREILAELSRIEDVTVVGYPDGVWDFVKNIPIVRKGVTATPLQIDFNGEPAFLVDAAIFNGASGSPVFLFNQGSYYTREGDFVKGSRMKLVGILNAVGLHSVTGNDAGDQNTASISIPNDLGRAIHARMLWDFEHMLRGHVSA